MRSLLVLGELDRVPAGQGGPLPDPVGSDEL
jgi:hypothetical protein